MSIAKKIFIQSMAISMSLFLLNGINMVLQHFAGKDIVMLWYHPMTIILTGLLCALPTVLLRNMDQWPPKTFICRVALHGLTLYAVVTGAGYVFGWYEDLVGFLCISAMFWVIYVFVWLCSHWMDKLDEKKINRALDEIRDSE